MGHNVSKFGVCCMHTPLVKKIEEPDASTTASEISIETLSGTESEEEIDIPDDDEDSEGEEFEPIQMMGEIPIPFPVMPAQMEMRDDTYHPRYHPKTPSGDSENELEMDPILNSSITRAALEDENLALHLTTVDAKKDKGNYWESPYKHIKTPRPMHLRFHRSLASYVMGRNYRRIAGVDVEAEGVATGEKLIPWPISLLANRTIKLYLRKHESPRDARFRLAFPEYDYLLNNIHYIRLLFTSSERGWDQFWVTIEENHRNQRRKGKLVEHWRTVYASHVWFIHGSKPFIILKGIEFDMCLTYDPRTTNTDNVISNPKGFRGMYKRRLDTMMATNYVALERLIDRIHIGNVIDNPTKHTTDKNSLKQ